MMTEEDIEKGKGEEKLSEKTSSLIRKLQQGNKLNITATTEPDYIPVRGTWHTQNSTEDFDLDEHVDKFLQGKEKVLLILGDSGAGKSVYCQQLIQRLQKDYSAIEGKPISLFISLPSLKDPVKRAIEETLQSYGLKEEEVAELKQNQKFIFIFDAYDEIRQDKNLYVTNKLKDWNAKIIITCRSQYLYTMDHYVKYFMPYQGEQRQGWLFSEVVIKPFNQEQIDQYLQQYVAHHKTEWSDWQEYKKYIDEIPGLRKLIETPFLLKLAVEALPNVVAMYQSNLIIPRLDRGIHSSSSSESSTSLDPAIQSRDDKGKSDDNATRQQIQLTRAKLYDVFVEQWFERQEKKLKDHRQIKAEENIQPKFWAYAKALAKEMQQQKVSQVFYETESVVFGESERENPWKKFFDDQNPQISLLRDCCLLQQISKNHYAFFHASLIDYFVTREVYEEINASPLFKQEETEDIKESKQEEDNPIISTKASAVKPLSSQQFYFSQRLFTQEPLTLQFLADRVQEDESFKEQLFSIIENSKQSEQVKIAAANAITVLNWARVSFSGMDFSHIKVPGADLSYGIYDHTNFSYADLSQVDFTQAWLRGATLSQSQMRGAQFSEKPYLKHDKKVNAIAYSRDGKYLAVASGEDIELWDWQTKEKFSTLNGHMGSIMNVVFSPDSETLASGSEYGIVWLWEVKSGQLRILSERTGYVRVVFSPDGEVLALGSNDNSVRLQLWDITQSGQVWSLSGHKGSVQSVAFSPDGETLASGSNDDVRLWNLKSGQSRTLSGHGSSVRRATFSPDGETLLLGHNDKTIRLWDLKSGQSRILSGHEENTYCEAVAFSPDGETLASMGSSDKTIRLWNLKSGQSRILSGHEGSVRSVAFSPNGETLASGSGDMDFTAHIVRLWDLKSGQSRILRGHTKSVASVAFSPDGETLASGSFDGTVRLWDVKSDQWRSLSGNEDSVQSVVFSPDGETLASASYGVRLWNVKSGQSRILNGHVGYVRSVAFSPDGETLALGSDRNRKNLTAQTVGLWDLKSGQSRILRGPTEAVVAFSPDGETLALGSTDNTIQIWDWRKGQTLFISKVHTGPVTSIAFDKTGKYLASAGLDEDDDTVLVLEIERKTSVVLRGLRTPYSVAWDTKGKYLAAAGTLMHASSGVVVWEVGSRQILCELPMNSYIKSIMWDVEGKHIAVGGDNTVQIWDVLGMRKRCDVLLEGYLGAVNSVAFYGNDYLATGCGDGAVKLWQRVPCGQDIVWQLQWSSHAASLYCEDAIIEGVQGLTGEQQTLLQQRGAKGQPLLESSSLLSGKPLASVKKSKVQSAWPKAKLNKLISLASAPRSFIAQLGHQTSPYVFSSSAMSLLGRFEYIQAYVIQGLKKEKWILLDPDTELHNDPRAQAVIHLKREIRDIRQEIESGKLTNMKTIKERLALRLSELIEIFQEKHSHTFLGKHHISKSKVVKGLEAVLKKLAQESEKMEEEISSVSQTSQKRNTP